MFYTYITTNKQRGTLYTGHTDDLGARIEQHKQKVFKGFSAKYGCNKLVWFETFETRNAAFTKERQIKKWKRAYKLNLIEKDNPHWLDIDIQPIWPPINPCPEKSPSNLPHTPRKQEPRTQELRDA